MVRRSSGRHVRRSAFRRRVAGLAVCALLAGLTPAVATLGAPTRASAAAPLVEQVSVSGDGVPAGAAQPVAAAVSSDGMLVAVAGQLDLHAGGHEQIYLRDRTHGTTTLISTAGGTDAGADGDSELAALSADGSVLAFNSAATDLVAGTSGDGGEQVYLWDRDSGTVRLVPTVESDHQTIAQAAFPSLSGDGGRLAFTRTEGAGAVLEVVDVKADHTTSTVSVVDLPAGLGLWDVSPVLSRDGSTLAYATPDLSDDPTQNAADATQWIVHVYDIASGTEVAALPTTLPDPPYAGQDSVATPSLSGDGQVVAYLDSRPDHTGYRPVGQGRLMIYDRGATDPQPVPVAGIDADRFGAHTPALSADGNLVAFSATRASDVSSGTPLFYQDGMWVADRRTGNSAQVRLVADGDDEPDIFSSTLSADGSTIVFTSDSQQLGKTGPGIQAFAVGTPHVNAPRFPEGAALGSADVTGDSLTLSWPAASGAPSGYRLERAGAAAVQVDADTLSYHVTGLAPATRYTFSVTPTASTGPDGDPLTGTVRTIGSATFAAEQVSGVGDSSDTGPAGGPAISADGQLIAYLAVPAGDGPTQVYLRDRRAGTTTLISASAADPSSAGNGESGPVAMSADGTIVAFASRATDLVPAGAATGSGIFLADLAHGGVRELPVDDTLTGIDALALSSDGARLGYAAQRESTAGDQEEDAGDVVRVVDTVDGSVRYERTSGESGDPHAPIALSGDGGTLTYVRGSDYVEAYDLSHPEYPLASDWCDADCDPSLSDDGRYLAISRRPYSSTTYLDARIEVHDLLEGSVQVVTGPEPGSDATSPRLSSDGSAVAFLAGEHAYLADPLDGNPAPVLADAQGQPVGTWTELAADADAGVIALVPDPAEDIPVGDGGPHLFAAVRAGAVIDVTAPLWPTGAALTATTTDQHTVRLDWPTASDAHAVHYVLTIDDGRPISLQAPGYTLEHLDPGSAHTFSVAAVDAGGNAAQPLTANATTVAYLDVASGDARSAGLNWTPTTDPDATGYRVERATGDSGDFATVADVPLSQVTYTDTGLLADTTYTYRVLLRTAAGTRAWSDEASVTTGSLHVDQPSVFTSTVELGQDVAPGSTIHLHATGTSGAHVSATLVPSDPGSAPITVALSELDTLRGRYDGSYVLDGSVDGLARVDVALTDGHATVSASADLALHVGGKLSVTVADSPDPLPGLALKVIGASGSTVPVAAGSTSTVTVDPGAFAVQLVTSDGDLVASGTATITANDTTQLDLTPVRHGTLGVRMTLPMGSNAMYVIRVATADGTVLASRSVDAYAGYAVDIGGLPLRTPLHVTATLGNDALRLQREVGTDVTLAAGGRTPITLAPQPLPTGSVTASTTLNGSPLEGTRITVSQHVDGRDWTFRGVTGADGTVSIGALAGRATVNADGVNVLDSGTTVTVPDGASVPAAFAMRELPGYHIRPHLFTEQADGSEVEQPLDWRTAVHFGLQVSVVGGQALSLLPDIVFAAVPGTGVRFCADGFQAGLASGCTTATLGTDQDTDLDLHLSQAGVADADLVDEAGTAYAGDWQANAYTVGPTGALTSAATASGRPGEQPRIGLPEAGDYVLVFAAGGKRTAPVNAHLADGAVVHLGTLTLHANLSTDTATLLVSPSPVPAGALADVRVELPSGRIRAGDRLALTVPGSATFEPDGTTVDGAAVPSAAENGTVSFPVSAGGGDRTVIRYALTIARSAKPAALDSIVRLLHSDGSIEEVGTAAIAVTGVTLAGPDTVDRPTFRLTGTAPAGADVTVFANDEIAGHATAGPGGRFTVTVTYAVPLSGFGRNVVATTTVDGVELRSDPLYVTYDENAIEPISATIENHANSSDGSRAISFDPGAGVASFTQVYVPGTPTEVTLKFADASRIGNFQAAVGSSTAAGSCSGNTCTATVPTSSSTVGDIYVGYDVAEQPAASMDALPAPSAEQLRHNLPGPFANASAKNWDPTASSGTFTLPGFGDMSVSSSAEPVGAYTPTAADEALRAGTGVQAYGVSAGISGTTLTATMSLPTAWLNDKLAQLNGTQLNGTGPDDSGGAPHAAAAMRTDTMTARSALMSPFALPPITEGFLTKLTFSLNWASFASLTNDLGEGIFGGGKFADLHDLDADIDTLMQCNPQMQQQAHDIVSRARMDVIVYKAFDDAFAVVGLLGGSVAEVAGYAGITAMGLDGALGGIIDQIANWNSDASVEQAQKDVAAAIDSTQCVGKKFHPMPPRKIASPTYIFDPSGYAYAGLASDRVADVTATLLSAPSADGPWTQWNAADYGQTNPQQTLGDGTYGWDVPKGYYKVRYSKDGYQTAYSEVVQVLPERMDLNADMLATAAPTVTAVALNGGGTAITLGFDQWMPLGPVGTGVAVRDAHGSAVAGTLSASDGGTAPDGTRLAKSFVFTPKKKLPAGETLTVTVAGTTRDYAGVSLGTDRSATVTTPGKSSGGGLGGWLGGLLGGLLKWILCRLLHLCR